MLAAKQKETKRNERKRFVKKENIDNYSENIVKNQEKRKETKTNKK